MPSSSQHPRPDPDAEYWTLADFAEWAGLAYGTVANYRADGRLPAPDATFGRRFFWKPRTLIVWYKHGRPGQGRRTDLMSH